MKNFFLKGITKTFVLFSEKTKKRLTYKDITVQDGFKILKNFWYYPIIHSPRNILLFIKKIIVLLLLSIMSLASIVGATTVMGPIILPAIRKLQKSRAEMMDEKHGIEYHEMKQYSIQQVKFMMKERKKDFEWQMDQNEKNIDNYELPILEGKYKLFIKRDRTAKRYSLGGVVVEGNNINISIRGKENAPQSKDKKGVVVDGIETNAKLIAKNVLDSTKITKEVSEFFRKNMGEFTQGDDKETMNFIEYALYEYMGIKKIEPVKLGSSFEKMTPEQMMEEARRIDTMQKIS